MREARAFHGLRAALTAASTLRFRVVHFSVQANHLHLLIEADDATAWRRGIQGLMIRLAKAVNRAIRRHGTVWADRYHAHLLRTPREVRHALVYVLQNWRKHRRDAHGLDPRSSAAWFTGWRVVTASHGVPPAPVAVARTWLARMGWRRHGLVGVEEAPRAGGVPRPGTE